VSTGRIVQVVILVLATIYLVIMQSANPAPLALPGLLPLPLWLIVAGVGVGAYVAGRLPAGLRAWRARREVQRLERRVAELESHVPSYDRSSDAPVIPDRGPPPQLERDDASA
jgi:hypothetical protein